MAAARRYSVLMTSLFRVTEQGMGSYEVLRYSNIVACSYVRAKSKSNKRLVTFVDLCLHSRASAFPVRLQDSEDSPVHWLGSQHVVRPFRYCIAMTTAVLP